MSFSTIVFGGMLVFLGIAYAASCLFGGEE
jgi:hypothetical protein